MSTFAFFTRLFLLTIISYSVVFSAGGESGEGVVVVPRKVPSLTIPLPQDDVQNCVGSSREEQYCVGSNCEEPFFMVVAIKPLPLSRTLSGCLRSFEKNQAEWRQAFEVFNYVAGQKRSYKKMIDEDKISLDTYARNGLTDNGFIWGPIGYESKDGAEVRKNGYQWLPFVFDMMGLVRDRPDGALQHLVPGKVLADFEGELGVVAGKCRADLEKIEKALATFAEAEKYVPKSPYVPNSSSVLMYGEFG